MTTLRVGFHIQRERECRKELRNGKTPPQIPGGRIPRVTRLMALAIRLEDLVRGGVLTDYAAAAQFGHVTRARMTQITNLLHLAPDIQEAILFLPRTEQGRDPIFERQVRPIVAELDWHKQRRMWRALRAQ